MANITKSKFFRRWLSLILAAILVLATVAFLYFINRPKIIEKQIDGLAGSIDTATSHPSDVMIRFEREYKGLKFQDALNLTQKEYDSLTKKEILKMQDERFENWVKIIEPQ